MFITPDVSVTSHLVEKVEQVEMIMPRMARLDAPGVLHHVIIRGIEGSDIFRDNMDRNGFLERLATLVDDTKSSCYAWSLLPNHAHFLFRSGNAGLPTLMRRLLTGYVVTFNRRHKRQGHLFQNRYKSIICQEDIYFKELVRYIHLNPIRAKIVADMDDLSSYRYCGHSVLLGKSKGHWQDTKYVLAHFGQKIKEAKKRYLSYIEAGIDQGRRPELLGGGLIRSLGGWTEARKRRSGGTDRVIGDTRILGESDFVMEVLEAADEKFERQYELRSQGFDLERLTQRVASIYQCDTKYILNRGRQRRRTEARSLLCYWAVRELGMSLREVARYLEMSSPAVGYAAERGEVLAKKNNYQLLV